MTGPPRLPPLRVRVVDDEVVYRRAVREVVCAAGDQETNRGAWRRAEAIGIGASTGGPKALAVVLSALPADLKAAVLVVQHMPPAFTRSFAAALDRHCPLVVREARDGEVVRPSRVLIAPGDCHMEVTAAANGMDRVIRISHGPPENNCRPSVNALFRSLAQRYPGRSAGILLTGMGSDGVAGLRAMRECGCRSIAQDEASCVVFGMPRGAIEGGVVDDVLPLDQIASEIQRLACPAQHEREAALS